MAAHRRSNAPGGVCFFGHGGTLAEVLAPPGRRFRGRERWRQVRSMHHSVAFGAHGNGGGTLAGPWGGDGLPPQSCGELLHGEALGRVLCEPRDPVCLWLSPRCGAALTSGWGRATGSQLNGSLTPSCHSGGSTGASPAAEAGPLVAPRIDPAQKEYFDTYFQVTPKPGRTLPGCLPPPSRSELRAAKRCAHGCCTRSYCRCGGSGMSRGVSRRLG